MDRTVPLESRHRLVEGPGGMQPPQLSLQSFVRQITDGLQSQEVGNVAPLLRLNNPRLQNLARDIANLDNLDRFCEQKFPQPFPEILAAHMRSIVHLHQGKFVEAYQQQANVIGLFIRMMQSETSWCLPILYVVCYNLRTAAREADKELSRRGQKADKQEDAARLLTNAFKLTITDRSTGPESKKWGSLHVINNLFKVYFRMNNLRLCRSLMRHVEGPNFLPFQEYPLSHRVTYCYYTGRLESFEANYRRAAEALQFAFERCTRRAPRNKRLALLYLIPVRLLLGQLPRPALLEKYGLRAQFEGLVAALRRGDLLSFSAHLARHHEFFIRRGIYLSLERLKFIAYRNLFKRVCLIRASNKIPLADFATALRWMGVQMDLDEVECVLANLIFQGYIRGYLSHQKAFLVISKGNAFPPLASLNLGA